MTVHHGYCPRPETVWPLGIQKNEPARLETMRSNWYDNCMKCELPTPVKWALNRLTSCHYEAYAVGGCVRDTILGQVPHDWDVTTSATPKQVIDCFADVRVVTTGLKHGTVTAMLDGQPVEITTYRVDGDYADHRRPDSVQFTLSLREDLARRDFTINAMAFRPDTGIVDFFGGVQDLRAGIVRCVGDPDTRFEEDALRILRALRFASRFDFSIESKTAEALLRHREELRYVAPERILKELSQMDFANIGEVYLPVLQVVVPELVSLDARPKLPPEPSIRLASLLHGLDVQKIMKRLRASAALTERVAALVSEMDTQVPVDRVAVRKLLRRIGPGAASQLLILQDNEAAMPMLREVLHDGDVYTLGQLDVNGNDLKKIGLEGKMIGLTLESLLTKVIEGELPNDNRKLVRAAGIATTIVGGI